MVVEVGKGKEVKGKEGAELYFKKENQENWSGHIVEREGGKEGWRRLSFFVPKSQSIFFFFFSNIKIQRGSPSWSKFM